MAATWTASERRRAYRHLRKLAEQLDVEINFVAGERWERWEASASTRQVWIPRPTRPTLYMVGLHEMGHVASTVASEWTPRYEEPGPNALIEGAAWAWGTLHAKPELAAYMGGEDWVELSSYFTSYLRWAAEQTPPELGAVLI